MHCTSSHQTFTVEVFHSGGCKHALSCQTLLLLLLKRVQKLEVQFVLRQGLCCFTCFTLEIGISAFPPLAGSFLIMCLVNTGLVIAVCDSLLDLYRTASGFRFHHFWRFRFCWPCCFGVVSLLDEDCNPGCGDCGRPLWLLLGVFICQRW